MYGVFVLILLAPLLCPQTPHAQEGRVGSKEYKTINAALLFADLKFQV